ncbi:hypothetical protein BN946_scf184569.g21 [Trametes cinnabarina]|uniref:Uncharacterized protein n=1 Tax=Pycnoporus cinnabarinus TaxID=5643 RepID=A0A060SDK1_PYCCI|nr:hypothetical protein BN946_scf184569.g21 [Trametes cinnabarina]
MSASSSSANTQLDEAASLKRPVSEMLSDTFVPFDHSSRIITPYDDETKRDAEFFAIVLEFHAWSTARPAHEHDKAADILEREIKNIRETEQEQGRSYPLLTPPTATASRLVGRRIAASHPFGALTW